ncbi:MAG: lipoate--protein ligase family protein [Bradyrhizobiaceae bacterium]|nr:lipoate--protein ligase family protein [Bradyrhizobiaceae bacterium]
MSSPLRLIETGLRAARWNVAMTAALAELHRTGQIPDTLRFHVYPKCVLIGRHQALAQAVDLDRCRRRGVALARRVTGGGAVYMAPGVLAWDLLMSRKSLGALDEAAAKICGAVAAGLSQLGLAARFRPANEIEIDGRKVSGASGCFEGSSLIHQGTVLIDADFEEMADVLALPAADLRERLTTLKGVLGRVPDVGEVMDALAAGISGSFRRPLERSAATAEELGLAAELLAEEIGSDAFVEGGEAAEASAAARPRLSAFAQDFRP